MTDPTLDMETSLDLAQAMDKIGMSIYSDEFACELLAWLQTVGGNNEAVVLNDSLCFALRACAQKLKIEAGETPDARLVSIMMAKVREAEAAIKYDQPMPKWINRIVKRYGLRMPEKNRDY